MKSNEVFSYIVKRDISDHERLYDSEFCMGQGLATVTHKLKLVNEFEVLFVLAISQ